MASMKKQKDQQLLEFAGRLKRVMSAKGIKKGVEMAGLIGCTGSFVSQMLAGSAMPSTSMLASMSKTLGVSLEYLATGTGPMMLAGSASPDVDVVSIHVISECDICAFLDGKKVEATGSELLPGSYAINSFIVEMPDNSMAPDIYKGENILIEPIDKIAPKHFSAYMISGSLTIGVERANGMLVPTSDLYAPVQIREDSRLLGRVRMRLSKQF